MSLELFCNFLKTKDVAALSDDEVIQIDSYISNNLMGSGLDELKIRTKSVFYKRGREENSKKIREALVKKSISSEFEMVFSTDALTKKGQVDWQISFDLISAISNFCCNFGFNVCFSNPVMIFHRDENGVQIEINNELRWYWLAKFTKKL